jgi:hypothetical protein
MTKKLAAVVLVLITAPVAAADWQPVLGDLNKSDRPDFGRLGGVVVNHNTGCVFVNLGERGIYCSSAGAGKFNPLSDQAAAGPDRKFVLALKEARGAQHGQVSGKNDKHVFALAKGGIVESTDGGASWTKPIALPEALKGAGPLWIEYDPQNDILYVMERGSDLYKLARRK